MASGEQKREKKKKIRDILNVTMQQMVALLSLAVISGKRMRIHKPNTNTKMQSKDLLGSTEESTENQKPID